MFGFVTASEQDMTPEQKARYGAVYCGICRGIRNSGSNAARVVLSYDMVFLALVLMSLYEPEESAGASACIRHPIQKRPWVDNAYIRYAADMNVALGYYNALDDWRDDRRLSARVLAGVLEKSCPQIAARWPRQCEAIRSCIRSLAELEQAGCADPDAAANCFGTLMGELLVYREDRWARCLRSMGHALGRFVYLCDAAVDYRKDVRKGRYNPLFAMGVGEDLERWEQYLVLDMAACTDDYERLPLVQDKPLLDNILYSGVWLRWRRHRAREERHGR